MATTTSGISNLDSYYQSLIKYTLTQEKVPLDTLTKRRDEVSVRKGVYTDLKIKFDTLNNAINALRSSQASFALIPGRAVTVSPATSGTTVASATVGNSASAGTYALSVTTLARAQEVRSIRQTYSTENLGMTGTFIIGGAADRSASIEGAGLPDMVASVESNNSTYVASGQKELGTGAYFIETREDATEGWQFRIVDAEGAAQNIKKVDGSEFTSGWQNIPVGSAYETGRGLNVTFGTGVYTATNMASGAVQVNQTAKGASIDVTGDMSLVEINSLINNATYAAGNEISSAIIDNTLVLRNQSSGLAHVMMAEDTTGNVLENLGILKINAEDPPNLILNTKVTGANASFSVNGMSMMRSSNTGLTDVIAGMTLNLASDAEGKSANLVVTSNMAAPQTTINTFMTALNDLTKYLRAKTTTTKNSDDTYTRGSLVGEQNFRYLSNDFISILNQDQTTTGIYQNLTQIGIVINSDLSLAIEDSSKLTTALSTHMSDVTKLFDSALETLSTRISTYVSTTGYINQSITNADSTIESYKARITSMNERLSRREVSLVKQYADLQAQMQTLTQQFKLNNTLYG
jgi:flagellar hook-associated protein 2